jgi:iron-sulfur cluster assembly accessory protein
MANGLNQAKVDAMVAFRQCLISAPLFGTLEVVGRAGELSLTSTPGGASMPLELTSKAVSKVKEIMSQQEPQPLGLRVGVAGGGCSGFSYQMNFESQSNPIDKVYEFDGLKVFIDQASLMYLNGTKIDYVETLEGAGFKFDNPNVKTTCGCGSSFSV